ncbi:HutD family protein [Plantibacter sp. Mn2098]|uniref:HutD family protein n=1 Tax=Plantibacter sp. Mn2098 TaxID=3395266 RepID=UPI003BC195A7
MAVVVREFSSLVPVPWVNGAGVTTTLAAGSAGDISVGRAVLGRSGGAGAGGAEVGAAGAAGAGASALAEADWRVSMAELNGPSTFSPFPGFDRIFTVIEDGVVELAIVDPVEESAGEAGGRGEHGEAPAAGPEVLRLSRFDEARFAGEASVACIPPTGRTLDLNLFTRRGVCTGAVTVSRVSDIARVSSHPRLVVVLEGGVLASDVPLFEAPASSSDGAAVLSDAVRAIGDVVWIPSGEAVRLTGALHVAVIELSALAAR